jgi:hypothetical protein
MGVVTSVPESEGNNKEYKKSYTDSDLRTEKKKNYLTKKKSSSDSYSSEEDEDKFKAAVQQASVASRLSEKKIYSKLAKEVHKPRKTTVDCEGMLNKNPDQEKGHNNMIKKGYYAKLGIERSPTMNSSVRYPIRLSQMPKKPLVNDSNMSNSRSRRGLYKK